MSKVLILGNGISRKIIPGVKDFVNNWPHEIWGCNRVFYEYLGGQLPSLDLLIGDYDALLEASYFHLGNCKIYGKTIKVKKILNYPILPIAKNFIHDSGTTLVSYAFLKKYDHIYLAGFDLGGKDVYMKDHEKKDKSTWVNHWRYLAKKFDFNKLEFVGKDHKKYILSNELSNKYAKLYMNNKNHIAV
jgi:hypothetical protein